MKRLLAALLLCACLTVALVAGAGSGAAKPPVPAPKGFFGIDPQSLLTEADARYMKAGGIETVRWPLTWGAVQPTRKGGYHWESFDPVVEIAARNGLQVLPILYGVPPWLNRKYTRMPIDNGAARKAWIGFVEAAVRRYGPGGEFWTQHAPGVQYETVIAQPLPIRNWQVWNEANIGYWKGTPEEFHKLYDYAVAGVRRALPTARVGGPETAGPGGKFAAAFVEHCCNGTNYATGEKGSPLDFVSFHAKGQPQFVEGHVRTGIAAQLRDIDRGFEVVASGPADTRFTRTRRGPRSRARYRAVASSAALATPIQS